MMRRSTNIWLGILSLSGASACGASSENTTPTPEPSSPSITGPTGTAATMTPGVGGTAPNAPSTTPEPSVPNTPAVPPTGSAGPVTPTDGAPNPTPPVTATDGAPNPTPPVTATDGAPNPTPPIDLPDPDFILGADVTWVLQDEAAGAEYFDQGVPMDPLQILQNHGFNYIRLRTFVNPENGYAQGQPEPWADLEHTIEMGQRIKQQGMGFLLDFHYSDDWADPGNQEKPAAWANLAFDDLVTTLGDYTSDVITQLIAAGARPDMVQIGNEIPSGMLFPDGMLPPGGASAGFPELGALLQAGSAAVRAIDPTIQIMLHIDQGGDNATSVWWLTNVLEQGVDFDILGQSAYTEFQGPPEGWAANLADLTSRPEFASVKFVIAEYSNEKQQANDIVHDLPDGRGLGTFIWEPTRWMESFFDRSGGNGGTYETNALIDIYPGLATAYGLTP